MIHPMASLPARRPELIACPFTENGRRLIRNRASDESFLLGEEECFLLSQLDGRKSADDVCAAFVRNFAAPLSAAELEQFIELSAQRGLLQDPQFEASDPGPLPSVSDSPLIGRVAGTTWKAASLDREEGIRIGPLRASCMEYVRLATEARRQLAYGLAPRWTETLACLGARRYARLQSELGNVQLEARDETGRILALLLTTPAYWDGNPGSLGTFAEYSERLSPPRSLGRFRSWAFFLSGQIGAVHWANRRWRERQRELSHCNSLVFLLMFVRPCARGRGISSRLIRSAAECARERGYDWILGPFRPSGYGAYKLQRKIGFARTNFREYCQTTDDRGLPIDPWLRQLTRHGMRMLTVDAGTSYPFPLAQFERFRQQHKPDLWYQPGDNVWECGETHSWHLVAGRRVVNVVEPNMWGAISLGVGSYTECGDFMGTQALSAGSTC